MSTDSEKNIERRFCDLAKRGGCLVYKFVSPNCRGVPDRLVITNYGRVVFVEFKGKGGRLSELQQAQIRKLTNNRAEVHVVSSHEEADILLEQIL